MSFSSCFMQWFSFICLKWKYQTSGFWEKLNKQNFDLKSGWVIIRYSLPGYNLSAINCLFSKIIVAWTFCFVILWKKHFHEYLLKIFAQCGVCKEVLESYIDYQLFTQTDIVKNISSSQEKYKNISFIVSVTELRKTV